LTKLSVRAQIKLLIRPTPPHTAYSDHSKSEAIKDKAAVSAHIEKVKQKFDDGVLCEDEYKSLDASFIAELNVQ